MNSTTRSSGKYPRLHERRPVARILVAEDDARMRDLIAEVLRHDGHEVFEADSGITGAREALRARRPESHGDRDARERARGCAVTSWAATWLLVAMTVCSTSVIDSSTHESTTTTQAAPPAPPESTPTPTVETPHCTSPVAGTIGLIRFSRGAVQATHGTTYCFPGRKT